MCEQKYINMRVKAICVGVRVKIYVQYVKKESVKCKRARMNYGLYGPS